MRSSRSDPDSPSTLNFRGGHCLIHIGREGSVTNTLCGGLCPTFGGIPVFLAGGATSAQVSIGANAIKNASLGTITKSNPSSTALVVVDGPTTKVTIAP
jgi:hypothetical protein